MKYTLTLASLAATALAGVCYAPAPAATSSSAAPTSTPAPGSGYFGAISARSGSPIHLLPLTARNGKIYLNNGPPTSYCPDSVGAANCPPGNTTVFAGGDKTLSLGVVVPGGQQVYVAGDGTLSYTVPHSGNIPSGAVVDGFSLTAPTSGNNLGTLNFGQGFVACPVGGQGGAYEVYGQTKEIFGSECLPFSVLTSTVSQPGAWEY